ncbi:acetyltransferase [Brachybacterium sp. ACRRE]|uniref:acetyltransferase n=1 Tax=Brachybacterium sp. ACRRE TaxID=2918184 RepID=UPI001EF36616|nr:acetyltransferase [Brachybacterium sp. ACRRE]MCG7308485.1 acetyltransferase [Brachybacterium sp. ACRRE]
MAQEHSPDPAAGATPGDAPDTADPIAPPAPARRPRPGWAPFLQVGTRVVVRYAIDRSASPHGEGMTDALGVIEDADEDTLTIATKRGSDRVVRGLVTAARPVPDPPRRRGGAGR